MTAPEIHRVTDGADDSFVIRDDGWQPRALTFIIEDGASSVLLTEAQVAATRDRLNDWLDAPRLAARETAEVVHRDDKIEAALVKTTAGEWGVRLDLEADEGGIRHETSWYRGEDAERDARRHYNGERDVESCCVCAAEIDESEPGVGDCEDGALCPGCADAAHQEWLASEVACVGGFASREAEGRPCGWRGRGADAAMVDGNSRQRECPTCGGDVELVDDEPAPAGEAPAP